ncbi:glycoside hydrolase family 43 protein [Gracilibacillus sp. YIM 98692]|uniref:glycoside hydrolase family 43 protein n=1 Tax=Gracilibacillus sp. YIM 98692 TaxID=2663532 RepID=UPI0013D11D40|nr:glycoside hydrolase family 43 protein [Gracilibacillus sp. YIM 98692]
MSIFNDASDVANPKKGHRLKDIPAHDPFIYSHPEEKVYYLFTSGAPNIHGMERYGVITYKSNDLIEWEGPYVVFTIPDGAWAHPQHGAWAPEVHLYNGKYFLFVTLHHQDKKLDDINDIPLPKHWRGTCIAVSDHPAGPYQLIKKDGPVVSAERMTLDGTLYIDEVEKPWMVFCHEWIQTVDGTIEAVPLTDNLSDVDGESVHLFSASEASWVTGEKPDGYDGTIYVSDGCQLYRTNSGRLIMLWSSYERGKYVQSIARSTSDKLGGPWEQLQPLVKGDSGHGMLFQTFEGQWMLILHQPFPMPESRCHLYLMEETSDTFRVINKWE